MARRLRYRAGSVFCIPLPGGGCARGVVSATGSRGLVIGHFFRPRLPACLDAVETWPLVPAAAIKVMRFGDRALLSGEWRVIGEVKPWKPEDWMTTRFVRREPITGRVLRVVYDEKQRFVREEPMRAIDESLPSNSQFGPTGVAIEVDEALAMADGLSVD